MKIINSVIFDYAHRLRMRIRRGGLLQEFNNKQAPLRSGLFNADQMEQHGKYLATVHKLVDKHTHGHLLLRLADNEDKLIEARNLLATAITSKRRVTPAGEWLLDNFYLIEEQIRTAKLHLPKGYSKELPCIKHLPSGGSLPRVYDIALEIISHGDARVDQESLIRFVAAYQTVTSLTLGELWAIPIMLRLALIDNIRLVSERIIAGRLDRNVADGWVNQMLDIAEKDPKNLILIVADMARSDPPMSAPFVSEITRGLQGKGPSLALPLTWIEQRLSEFSLTTEGIIQTGNQTQAADQVSISNSIGGLRFLTAMDWRAFVETVSVVEQNLSKDPGGVYSQMDFATRDQYRHVVEKLAKQSPYSEEEIAEKATQLANASVLTKGLNERSSHVGFYLIDKELPALEAAVNARLSILEKVQRIGKRLPLLIYLGTILGLTLLFTIGLISIALDGSNVTDSDSSIWILVLLGLLSLVAASQLASLLTNWCATLFIKPHQLPRLDFSEGIPLNAKTIVVVPSMLTDIQGINDLVEGLEVRFLANRDKNLHFALLTDYRDANIKTLPQDAALLAFVQQRINELNTKYSDSRTDAFYLFHRPRRWNAEEDKWMGYERKRGKLAALNMFLRDGSDKHFSSIVGETAKLVDVKYVITLDTDTQLPRDSARQFAATMAHPLNRPVYDKHKMRVSEGYGILQPRVMMSVSGTHRSIYARLHGDELGIDPYTRTVSNVYQDVFQEGSFIGKGIYDVDAFELSIASRFAENRVLSHDLLEGCYARSGLLSDVELQEEYPPRYSADISRRYRWIRGDWQLIGWLLPNIKMSSVQSNANPLSSLSRWKIFDNLRRSVVPISETSLLIIGWLWVQNVPIWTIAVVGIFIAQPVLATILEMFRKPIHMLFSHHFSTVGKSAKRSLFHTGFSFACLPYEAFISLDAIIRTFWRMFITHTKLLEWTPSGDEGLNKRTDLISSFRTMWISPAIAFVGLIYFSISRPDALLTISPILTLWFFAPMIAWWISSPLHKRGIKQTNQQTMFLRRLARKTWRFFEAFMGPADNWLPPDNYQEHPVDRIAHRTSPTNIGLALLANLTAYDFCYIPVGRLLERTKSTLDTMQLLDRYKGHFYNWYDTQTLKPLFPIYISTVDSGNLVAHLLTLKNGLEALADQNIFDNRYYEGLKDTLEILIESAGESKVTVLAEFEKELTAAILYPSETLVKAFFTLQRLTAQSNVIVADLTEDEECRYWAHALSRQCYIMLDEIIYLAPWLTLVDLNKKLSLNDLVEYIGKPTLRDVSQLDIKINPMIEIALNENPSSEELEIIGKFQGCINESINRANARVLSLNALISQITEFASIEYEFLYDKNRHLLTIGYNVEERRADSGYYDLLASEARLCNFVGIAQGKLPQESWFSLGRLLTVCEGEPILLSWSGSMFEYLMPLLVMPNYEDTLLDQTYKSVIKKQIQYGKQRGVPWGISESGYNTVDTSLNYQYSAFGAPGLGLKRGLADDLVIAPYASVLALMVAPEEACVNLQRLAADGFMGRFGLYEAIDYTPSRLPRGQSNAVIRSFMAHHLGMSFLSLSYLLLDRPMQKRFESDPAFKATLLLLQERIPRMTSFYSHSTELSEVHSISSNAEMPIRVLSTPNTNAPEVQLLSNGKYHVMITNAGGGYSRWRDLAVTRWREDTTRDNWGTFCYIRDTTSGAYWSAAHQPTLQNSEHYQAIFSEGRAEFRRRDDEFDTHTEIVVSPEDDIEIRRVQITNRSRINRTIDITSYAEVVLASGAADAAHPAFSNLFVQTEIIGERQAILCTRRPRSLDEYVPWMFHLVTVHDTNIEEISYETDRMKFIGRGNTPSEPISMGDVTTLSNTDGSVLDPIVAIRTKVTIEPEQTITFNMVLGVAESRENALTLIHKYQDRRLMDRVFELAWTHSQVVLRQINATEADAQLYGRLASSIIYANALHRADKNILLKNFRGQSGLWGYAISGDLPIVLLQIKDAENIELVRQLIQAHVYWHLRGLVVDLVIWNEDHNGYRQLLQENIIGLIASGIEAHAIDRPGGIFVRHIEQISDEHRTLFQAVARIVITDSAGTLEEQLNYRAVAESRVPQLITNNMQYTYPKTSLPKHEIILSNELGGFKPDGSEYIITLTNGETTPAPWINVLANSYFGTVISESGIAYTWYQNAHQYRLSPWGNDPISDSGGEIFYIRDEESGRFWSPTPLPIRKSSPYVIRHGFGYSVFEHIEDGIHSELTVYVALDAPIKFSVLKVRNQSNRIRRLSATGYVEWVLGDLRPKTTMHVVTEIDSKTGAIYARNSYNSEFADWTAFFEADSPIRTITCDRNEFLGRNGDLKSPASMRRSSLSGKVGAGLDQCAAIQGVFELAYGEEHEIVFKLGAAENREIAHNVLQRFQKSMDVKNALTEVRKYWTHTLSAVKVETPDESINVLANGWLAYQTLACRVWARSGYYQSGGAFGFRDQLQDVMALIHAVPQLVREHILLCASRQFLEGDVQHWWHPPSGRGVRTHCSDDYLWLPLAVCRYVFTTGDNAVLDAEINFLDGRQVNPQDDSYYDMPNRSADTATLYQHCFLAIQRGLKKGEHGLPLIGTGDWNDGMNIVGKDGRGESIWLGFFLCEVLKQFTKLALRRGDMATANQCESEKNILASNLEKNGWDGEWYRRAYFDDGTPLGSAENEECRIDSISQSWSVLSEAADTDRSKTAMNSVDKYLVRRDHALIQLLDPPFNKSNQDPGYIRGYVPGVRENGGQYTHSAIWAAMAFAKLGDSKRAWELATIINPINHAKSKKDVSIYKVEPYVISADVYAVAPHTGRGGWSWYTGSAGWMYRLILESLLGLNLEDHKLRFKPCIPIDWKEFKMHYRFMDTMFHISISQTMTDTNGINVFVDGVQSSASTVDLVNDQIEHFVDVKINTIATTSSGVHHE